MINVENLLEELISAGLPVVSVRDGLPVADYSRPLTNEEQTLAGQIVSAHNPDTKLPVVQGIINTAKSAEGVKLSDLTAAQIKALMACLLWKAGGVDKNTVTVKNLEMWM